jgi:hypothetical protein
MADGDAYASGSADRRFGQGWEFFVSGARARVVFTAVALCAVIGVVLSFVVAAFGLGAAPSDIPGLFGENGDGIGGLIGRLGDYISYFTTDSNILVVIVFGVLALRGVDRGPVFRAVFFSALLMILITGVVYGVVLRGGIERQGLDVVSNLFVHYLTPLAALIGWAVAGPFGWVRLRLVPAILVLPVLWLIATLIRGAIIGEYPYDFLNVVDLGYGLVLVNVLVVVALAAVLCGIFLAVDRVRRRRLAVA